MRTITQDVATLADLQQFVHHTLCAAENLLPEQFRTQARALLSGERVCGMEYTLFGLRSVRLSAVWAADQNVVYVYNARGERTLKVQLTRTLDVSGVMDSVVLAKSA